MQMVAQGRMSAAQATAAIKAKRTLGQEEIRQGRDIDGVGGIGNGSQSSHTSRSDQSPESRPIQNDPPAKHYTLGQVLSYSKLSIEQIAELVQDAGLVDGNKAFNYLGMEGYLPEDMRRGNFMELYNRHILPLLTPLIYPTPVSSKPGNNGNGPYPKS